MKKVLFVAFIAIIGLGKVNAQESSINVGVNFGLPTGDASDISSFAVGAEVNYLFEISDKFKVGPSISYTTYFGKTITVLGISVDIDDVSFLPLAAAGRYNLSEKFVLGADLGYGIGINPDGNDGGFYYRPMIGFQLGEKISLQASYSNVSVDGGTFSNFGIGIMFSL